MNAMNVAFLRRGCEALSDNSSVRHGPLAADSCDAETMFFNVFWTGIIGKFMYFLPITLIISLLASLLVAYIINPVFAVDFMKPHEEEAKSFGKITRSTRNRLILYGVLALLSYVSGHVGIGNFIVFLGLFLVLNRLWLYKVIEAWQFKAWPRFIALYTRALTWCLHKPWRTVYMTIALFFASIVFFILRGPKVQFFPQGDPNSIYVYLKLPDGTDPSVTNSVMRQVENKVNTVLGKQNPIVESMISNVTIGVTDPRDGDQNAYPNRGKIAINFVEFEDRNGVSTGLFLKKLQEIDWNIPGAEITVNKEQNGPPQAKPVSIEISGNDFEALVRQSVMVKQMIEQSGIEGIDNIKSDFVNNKPEIVFDIDRERAQREGISAAQLAMEIRGAVFGVEATKFRDVDDEYPVQLRYRADQRNDIETIKNIKLTFRDMNMGGMVRSVPISSLCKVRYDYTYSGIKRKNNERVITLSSDVKEGFNPNEVAAKVKQKVDVYRHSDPVMVKFAGQSEDQKETSGFLGRAMLISVALMLQHQVV